MTSSFGKGKTPHPTFSPCPPPSPSPKSYKNTIHIRATVSLLVARCAVRKMQVRWTFSHLLGEDSARKQSIFVEESSEEGGGGGEQRKRAQRHIHGAIESSVYFRILSTSVCSYQCITPQKKKKTDRFTAPTSDQPLYNFYVAQADTILSPQDCCVSK